MRVFSVGVSMTCSLRLVSLIEAIGIVEIFWSHAELRCELPQYLHDRLLGSHRLLWFHKVVSKGLMEGQRLDCKHQHGLA